MSKILRIQTRFIIMSYKLIYQFPSIIVGGFLEATVTILSFFIFWQVVLIGQTFQNWLLPDILIFSAELIYLLQVKLTLLLVDKLIAAGIRNISQKQSPQQEYV